MLKRPWKECHCGVTTDPDQEECPERGLGDNPKHQLRLVELSDAELISRIRGGKKVYTKDHSSLGSILKGEIVGLALSREESPP